MTLQEIVWRKTNETNKIIGTDCVREGYRTILEHAENDVSSRCVLRGGLAFSVYRRGKGTVAFCALLRSDRSVLSSGQRSDSPSFLVENREIVGFVVYCIYASEDGKCFVLDFYVIPSLRNKGTGSAFFALFKEWAEREGAAYFELNTHCVRALRFWKRQGFLENGADDAGVILLCLPPKEQGEFTRLERPDLCDVDLLWQVRKLINGWRKESDHPPITDEEMKRLCESLKQETVSMTLVRRGYRAVGMCLLKNGVCKVVFVEPVFRCEIVQRLLPAHSER